LGQYYFGISYAAAFFERFVVKTNRYQSAFLSQSLQKQFHLIAYETYINDNAETTPTPIIL